MARPIANNLFLSRLYSISAAAVVLLGLISCSLFSNGSEEGTDGSAASDTASQSGETGSDGGTGFGQGGPCYNKYYPLTPDVVRRYGVFTGKTSDSEDYSDPPTTYIKKQKEKDERSFTETLEFSNGITTSVIWECTAEGLRNDQLFGTLRGPDMDGKVVIEKTSGVYLPKDDWRVGTKWSYEIKVRIEGGSSGGGDLTNDARIDYEIISMDDRVSVPGGEFTAARLDSVSTMNVGIPGRPGVPVTLKNSEWYAPGVGLVKLSQTGSNTATSVYLGEQD